MRGPSSANLPVGGRLRHFWPVWHRMGANRRVVRWLKFGFPLRFDQSYVAQKGLPPLSLHPPDSLIASYQDQSKQSVLKRNVDIVSSETVRNSHVRGEVGFFSRVFLVPKKSGGFRLVIDLSALNEWLAPVTFTMDTLKVVKETVQEGMWATSLDLSDAYHHIPIHPQYQKYLCFQVGDLKFRHLVLPFGLMSAPWAFTEVVKQIKKWTVQFDIILFQYLDDWLNVHQSAHQCEYLTQVLMRLCTLLGLLVNESKSEFVPTQSIVFLGERLDLLHSRAYLVPERRLAIQSSVGAATPARGPPVLQSGVATRSTGLRISDSSVRSPPSPQSSDKSNSGVSTRSRSQLVDSSTRPARGSSQVVVEGGCNVGGHVASPSGARGSDFHRRVHKRMGRIMRR